MISLAILATAVFLSLMHLPRFEEDLEVEGYAEHAYAFVLVAFIYTVIGHLGWGVVHLWFKALT